MLLLAELCVGELIWTNFEILFLGMSNNIRLFLQYVHLQSLSWTNE